MRASSLSASVSVALGAACLRWWLLRGVRVAWLAALGQLSFLFCCFFYCFTAISPPPPPLTKEPQNKPHSTRAMGTQMVCLTPSRGFAAELATALVILVSSQWVCM